jgi:hypothetical protein
MQDTPLPAAALELDAALLQGTITAALAALCAFLFTRYRKPYFAWWAAAWTLYFLRIVAITSFLISSERSWLYWHQVITGWTGLALLYAALVFSQQVSWRWWYLGLVLFPPVWSYIAIYRLDHFLWAAGPAVVFLSLATMWTSYAPGGSIWALGPPSPRLPLPTSPRSLGSLGLLHRHPAGPRSGCWDTASRAGRSTPRAGGAFRALR